MIVKEGDKFVALVDLGDGSTPQKFYGDTHEAVIAELIKAQTHATRTIKQQKTLIKTSPAVDRGTEITQNTEMTLEESKEAAEKLRLEVTTQKFLRTHPDFIECAENEKFILDYLESRQADYSVNNLSLAYEELKDILKLKAAIPPTVEAVIPSNVTVRNRLASTGLPSNTSVPRPSPPVGLTVREIETMPPSEYNTKFRDPKFREAVDKAYEKARSPK